MLKHLFDGNEGICDKTGTQVKCSFYYVLLWDLQIVTRGRDSHLPDAIWAHKHIWAFREAIVGEIS